MLSAGLKAAHVPFRGAPDVLREILGGLIDFYFSPLRSQGWTREVCISPPFLVLKSIR
jgi:hypothetical protein